jgi:hypothetical protein
MYAWYRFADVKNDKSFLELRCEENAKRRSRLFVTLREHEGRFEIFAG